MDSPQAPRPSDEASFEGELEQLTAAAAGGDRGALERLLEHYLPDLRAFVRLKAGAAIRARESASDLVQSVCRQVLEQADNFQHPNEAAFRRWLFTTASRKIANRAEYHGAERRDPRREVRITQGVEPAGDARLLTSYRGFVTPTRAFGLKEEMERLEAAFDGLEEEERELVLEAHLLGTPRAELARRLGKSDVAVRVQLHRAMAKLAVLLGD